MYIKNLKFVRIFDIIELKFKGYRKDWLIIVVLELIIQLNVWNIKLENVFLIMV